jgi:hypothetical protein
MEYRPKEPSIEATPSLIERIEATWQRARDHKVIQWSLGYFGVAFVLAQVEQIIAQTYDWPSVVGRVFITVLIVLLPVAPTVAWYQGYRGLKRFESAEIAVISGRFSQARSLSTLLCRSHAAPSASLGQTCQRKGRRFSTSP